MVPRHCCALPLSRRKKSSPSKISLQDRFRTCFIVLLCKLSYFALLLKISFLLLPTSSDILFLMFPGLFARESSKMCLHVRHHFKPVLYSLLPSQSKHCAYLQETDAACWCSLIGQGGKSSEIPASPSCTSLAAVSTSDSGAHGLRQYYHMGDEWLVDGRTKSMQL